VAAQAFNIPRIPTYVEGLDELLEGGVPAGDVVLVAGGTGTLKSSFSFNILYGHARRQGGIGLYLSLEQDREELISHMMHMGINYPTVKDRLYVIDLGTLRAEIQRMQQNRFPDVQGAPRVNWLHSLKKQIGQYKQMLSVNLLVLDSLEALYALSESANPRDELFHFFKHLKSLKMTSFLISEMDEGQQKYGKFGVEPFLADGIVNLVMRENNLSVGRYIRVVKMRRTKHSTDYFPLVVDETGFSIVTKG
jgi:circadian clock protein KaiC